MPKAVLSFDLPEEAREHEICINGGKYISCLQEFDNFLRSKLKYAELSEEAHNSFEEARNFLHDLATSEGFSIWDWLPILIGVFFLEVFWIQLYCKTFARKTTF